MLSRSVRPSVRNCLRRLGAALIPILAASAAPAQDLAKLPDLVEHVAPSVVTINIVYVPADAPAGSAENSTNVPEELKNVPVIKDFLEKSAKQSAPSSEAAEKKPGLVSGMVLTPDGYIITVGNVVDSVIEISVTLDDSTRLAAKLVGVDKRTNIALLKIEAPKPLAEVHFADSAKVRRGEPIIVIGNPYGLPGSVSLGIISATKRDIGAGPYDLFQTDATINPGNSGGPLFDFNGEVVGMATAIYSPGKGSIGIGFALPSNLVQKVANELKQTGSVERGWLGVKIQNVDEDTAASLGLKSAKGALITEIIKDGPAAGADLKTSDAVLQINGQEVADSRSLARIIADEKPDATAEFVIWRDRQKKTVPVRLGRFPDAAPTAAPESKAVASKDTGTARFPGLKVEASDKGGLVVTAIDAGSDAEAKGIKTGDIILDAGGIATKAPKDLTNAIAEKGSGGAILLRVKRSDDKIVYVALRLSGSTAVLPAAPPADDFKDLDRLE